MTEFRSPVALPPIPDQLSIPQFILRPGSPNGPNRPRNSPFFIEDGTGRTVSYEEVGAPSQTTYHRSCLTVYQAHRRTYGIANALSIKWKLGMSLHFSYTH